MYKHYCKGKLVETREGREGKGFSVWDVFEEYADIRDELEDLLDGFRSMREDIELAVDDLEGGLEDVGSHLARCDKVFRRFKAKRRREEDEFEAKCCDAGNGGKEELAFDGVPASRAESFSLI